LPWQGQHFTPAGIAQAKIWGIPRSFKQITPAFCMTILKIRRIEEKQGEMTVRE
jgi:hypothetical protein